MAKTYIPGPLVTADKQIFFSEENNNNKNIYFFFSADI